MRKKWGIILGLTGMMLLGSQSIYAAEAADGTAETTDAANEKETAGTDGIESRIKKGGFTAGVSVHDPSVIKDNDTYYIFGLPYGICEVHRSEKIGPVFSSGGQC